MSWIISHFFIATTYGFLFLAILCLWLPDKHKIRIWLQCFIVAVICGLLGNILNGWGLLAIVIFATSVYYLNAHPKITIPLIIIIGLALKLHLAPGFHNLNIVRNVLLTPDAIPYSFYINLDEAVIGIFILGFAHHLISQGYSWRKLFGQTVPCTLVVIVVMGVLSYASGLIRFEPKFPIFTLVWAVTNLFIVCLTEEAFFRGFIQKRLSEHLAKFKWGQWFSIFLTALLFGALHYPGGYTYVILAIVAGIGYGWVYARVQLIEASIFAHFSVNLLQFLLFTYPALASVR